MYKKKIITGLFSALVLIGCSSTRIYENQSKIDNYVQTGIYYYWNGGDLKKVEKEFFKGITLKGKYDVVENSFKKAADLDPKRLDLKFGIATSQILQKKTDEAITSYKKIVSIYPNSFEGNILLAGYSNALGDSKTFNERLEAMKKVYPNRTKEYMKRFERTENNMKAKFNVKARALNKENHAIVILGYALAENGVMRAPLIERLNQGLKLANKNLNSKIIVTGGVPKGGVTEAYLMKKWLVSKGIKEERIFIEDKAKDTVGNALYSVKIMKNLGIENLTVISSASHMRRALTVFKEMSVTEDLDLKSIDNLVYLDYPSMADAYKISQNEKLVIYRDMMRASGIWAFPGIQR